MDEVASQLWLTDLKTVITNDLERFDRVITVCDEDVTDVVPCEHNQFKLDSATFTTTSESNYNYDRFAAAVNRLVEALADGEIVLTHCGSGISRSVSVASAAVARRNKQSLEEAFRHIKQQRPDANPSDLYQNHAKKYAARHYPPSL